MLDDFISKIHGKHFKVGVIGLGYVGIPLAQRITETGLAVLGFDIDAERVSQLNDGTSPIKHIPDMQISGMRRCGFSATEDFSRTAECDALIICVPTPLSKYREPDLSFVSATMDTISPFLRRGQLVALESTTWPGTTDEVLAPYLLRAGLTPGEDAFLVYSPEREDPGNPSFRTETIPRVRTHKPV